MHRTITIFIIAPVLTAPEDKKSSSILEKPLNKGISKETWKMEEKFDRFHESTIGRVKCELA